MLPWYFTREPARKCAYKFTFKPVNSMFQDDVWFGGGGGSVSQNIGSMTFKNHFHFWY
jgi:hypothetical protein